VPRPRRGSAGLPTVSTGRARLATTTDASSDDVRPSGRNCPRPRPAARESRSHRIRLPVPSDFRGRVRRDTTSDTPAHPGSRWTDTERIRQDEAAGYLRRIAG
jgi:hypothetical protein